MHVGYCDELYSVAEFYFHAPAKRAYRAELSLDRGSAVDLLVHNVSLDDVLAGVERRAIKTRTTLASAEAAAEAARKELAQTGQKPAELLLAEARAQRDAAIWNGFPPVNTQGSEFAVGRSGYGTVSGVRAGGAELTGEQIVEQYGTWEPPTRPQDVAWADVPAEQIFLANAKLRLVYTLDDLHARRPLPDPYPLKDDGAGLFFPDAGDPNTGAAWTPIGNRVHQLHREYYQRSRLGAAAVQAARAIRRRPRRGADAGPLGLRLSDARLQPLSDQHRPRPRSVRPRLQLPPPRDRGLLPAALPDVRRSAAVPVRRTVRVSSAATSSWPSPWAASCRGSSRRRT